MSIIERAVELLRTTPQTRAEPPTTAKGSGNLEQDPIARVVEEIGRRGAIPEAKPASSRGTARTFRVDRERLRQQGMIAPEDKRSVITESFRHVKRTILANAADPKAGAPPANLVMVTSASPGEGKTFCAINLAISIALEVDRTVLLVDGDVAKPGVLQALGLEADKGFMDVLFDRRIDLADVLWKTDVGRLTLAPVGTAHKHATELLASNAMRELLRQMAGRYGERIIIFDSPPLLAASEADVLASQMGQVVVVVEAGKTTEPALKSALGRIDAGRVAGLLLNKTQGSSLEGGYSAYYA
jgi:exopolysaccharide/PEP-CTERM locus tyrosine autokinase